MSIYDNLQMRIATPDDVTEVMELAVAAAKENGALNANQELLLRAVWGPLNQQSGLVGCIGAPRGKIEGMVVLQVGTLFYSEDQALEEKVVYVRPEYRNAKGGRARQLCEFSKSVADKLKLPLIIGVFSTIHTQQKIGLYKRIFGEPAGLYFLYGGQTGQKAVI